MKVNWGYAFLIVLIILIIVIWLWRGEQENFDTYRNHDFGAYYVYKNSNVKPITVDQAALQAKYNWSVRDVLGNTVYDQMYDGVVQAKNWSIDRHDYDTQNLDNIYDSKFSIFNGESQLAEYKISDMLDKDSVRVIFNGQ